MPGSDTFTRRSDDELNAFPYKFEKRIAHFSEEERSSIQCHLDKQLGPEFISSRQGPGGVRLHYVAAEKVINLANEIFGFNGWSTSIQNVTTDFLDENSSGRITLGVSVIMRVTLKDGTFHEDIGYGQIENCKGKAAAFEKAKKEAVSDGLKRALRSFGNVLGNCLYDKAYLQQVMRVKAQPTRVWCESNLHRHQDFLPIKEDVVTKARVEPENVVDKSIAHKALITGRNSEPIKVDETQRLASLKSESSDYGLEGDYAVLDEICEASYVRYDEVMLETGAFEDESVRSRPIVEKENHEHQDGNLQDRGDSRVGKVQLQCQPEDKMVMSKNGKAEGDPELKEGDSVVTLVVQPALQKPLPRAAVPPSDVRKTSRETPPEATHQHFHHQKGKPNGMGSGTTPVTPIAFVTGRAALEVQENGNPMIPVPPNTKVFNPAVDSPSLRRTAGINHASSRPIRRQDVMNHVQAEEKGSGNTEMRNGITNGQAGDAENHQTLRGHPQVNGGVSGSGNPHYHQQHHHHQQQQQQHQQLQFSHPTPNQIGIPNTESHKFGTRAPDPGFPCNSRGSEPAAAGNQGLARGSVAANFVNPQFDTNRRIGMPCGGNPRYGNGPGLGPVDGSHSVSTSHALGNVTTPYCPPFRPLQSLKRPLESGAPANGSAHLAQSTGTSVACGIRPGPANDINFKPNNSNDSRSTLSSSTSAASSGSNFSNTSAYPADSFKRSKGD